MVELAVVLASAPVWGPVTLVSALLVRATMGSPVLFRQRRVGLEEEPFEILKFRTMRPATDGRELDSERLTRMGRVLRRLSLDELPQLINVLRGDMALIGPRPLYPEYLPVYTGRERLRHAVRPGITGLAQTQGRNGLLWNDRLELDARYVERWTLRADLEILSNTLRRVVTSDGAVANPRETGEPLHIERRYPRTPTLALRRFSLADVRTRVQWMSDPRVRRHMQLPNEPSIPDTVGWFRANLGSSSRVDLVVYDRADNAVVAMAGLKRTAEHVFPELYLFVDPARQGEGIGKQTLELVHQWLNESKRFRGSRLTVHAGNVRARKLYESSGYTVDRIDGDRLYMSRSTAEAKE